MKLRISSYLARVSWFRRKNHKKKSKTKLKQAIKLTFMLFFFFFCCRDYCKVGNSGITNLIRKHLCLIYFGKYYTTLNQKLWWMSFTAAQHMHVSRPIQIYILLYYFKIVVTEFRQAMTASVRSCDLNDFAGSKVAKQTFFSRHIKSYLRLLPTQLKARNYIFTV